IDIATGLSESARKHLIDQVNATPLEGLDDLGPKLMIEIARAQGIELLMGQNELPPEKSSAWITRILTAQNLHELQTDCETIRGQIAVASSAVRRRASATAREAREAEEAQRKQELRKILAADAPKIDEQLIASLREEIDQASGNHQLDDLGTRIEALRNAVSWLKYGSRLLNNVIECLARGEKDKRLRLAEYLTSVGVPSEEDLWRLLGYRRR
ncbi:MAG: hypothetical protein V1798_12500, partial [Pseudomonadota bacterium]